MAASLNFVVAVLVAAVVAQWLVLVCIRRGGWLAPVNSRSSHSVPTPTLGGVVFVAAGLIYLAYLLGSGSGTDVGQMAGGWLLGLALVAGFGLWDDLQPLSARVRLVAQVLAAASVLWGLELQLPWYALGACLLALVWSTNLFNFMDGIDGIAAVQALTFCLGVQWLCGGIPGWMGDLVWIISAATLGFLAFNWPPAKIFMGDVGSGFLGLLTGGVVIYLWQLELLPLVSGLLLLAAFWFDATYTLCVRIITGQAFTQAHRSHLYQHLSQRHGHLWTTSIFALFNVVWLWPWAWLSQNWPAWQWACLILAISPLAVACMMYRAGTQFREEI